LLPEESGGSPLEGPEPLDGGLLEEYSLDECALDDGMLDEPLDPDELLESQQT
jgi:hypothetical protein